MNRKVCFLGTEITPSVDSTFVGGGVNVIINLSKGLSDLGWKIHIVTTPSRFLKVKKTEFNFLWGEIQTVKVKGKYGSLKYGADFLVNAIRAIQRLDRDEAFDLIHAHSSFLSIATIPVIIKRKLGIPALFSLYSSAQLLPIKSPIDKYCIKILSNNLDKVIAVTNNVKKSLVKRGVSENKIDVIPPCINGDVFNPNILGVNVFNEVKTKNPKTQKVLFIGNIDRSKGLDVFLNAAEFILHRNLEVKFVITLHEPYETIQHIKAIASRRLGSSVAVMGVVKDMPCLMASADVVVAPFRNTEAIVDIPIIIPEAMAMGKPVVASKVGGVTEVISDGENGVLVEPNQADELANAIIGLINDSNLRKEISKKAVHSIKQFSNIDLSRRLNDLYMKIIKNTD